MQELLRVDHIGVRISDFEVSRRFYNKLGFETLLEPGSAPIAIVEHPSGISLNLILNADQRDDGNVLMDVPTKHTGYTHVALGVSDAGEAIKQLQKLGINLSGEPQKNITGTSFFIRDPDRNVIEFIQPHTPKH